MSGCSRWKGDDKASRLTDETGWGRDGGGMRRPSPSMQEIKPQGGGRCGGGGAAAVGDAGGGGGGGLVG